MGEPLDENTVQDYVEDLRMRYAYALDQRDAEFNANRRLWAALVGVFALAASLLAISVWLAVTC
jgi:hypothetical protein